MISFSQLNEMQILVFGLILLRMIAFVVSSAVFSAAQIPVPLKVLMAVVFTLVIYSSVASNEVIVRMKESQDQLLLLSAREVLIGISLGFVTRLFFFAVGMAGELVSISMGLGQAQMFNPMMGSMGNAMEQFYMVIGTLVFLGFNGHHFMIQGVVQSYQTVPLAELTLVPQTFAEIVYKIQEFFVIAIKIAAPVLISMIIIQFGMALLSRVVPQINVIVTSASLTVVLGFVILFICLPLLVSQMGGMMSLSLDEFFKFLKAI